METKGGLLPIKINVDKAYIGTKDIVILDGKNTYHIPIEQFFNSAAFPNLLTCYGLHLADKDTEVRKRIEELNKNLKV